MTLFLSSLIAFLLVSALPGNTARNLLGPEATAEQIEQFERQLGLDQSVPQRYVSWLSGIARGDLGRSLASGQEVADELLRATGPTVALMLYVFALAIPSAILAACLCARWPDGPLSAIFKVLTTTGLAAAPYVVAVLLVLAFSVGLKVLPSFGYVEPSTQFVGFLRSLTLPAVSLALPLWSLYSRFLASDLQHQLQRKEYIWAAEARGIGRWRVIIHHALRSSLGSLLSVVGLHVSALLGGAVVIELIFGIPGVGRLLVDAVELRDLPVIQAVVIWAAVTTILVTVLADAVNSYLDPRTKIA